MENKVTGKIRAGKVPVGTFIQTNSQITVEALGYTGLDFVVIDMEHTPLGTEGMEKLVGAARAVSLTPAVRIDSIERASVLKSLDTGAQVLVVPNLRTVDEAKKLVEWGRFPPVGDRGFCPTRDGGWGLDENMRGTAEEYMEWANSSTLILPQCETRECLDDLEEIVAVDGIDGVFIGPYDLSISLGIPSRFDEPLFKNAVKRVIDVCHAAGKLAFAFVAGTEGAKEHIANGMDGVIVGIDLGILQAGYKEIVEAFK